MSNLKGEFKIGSIIKDKITNKYGIIVSKYTKGRFDWEIFSLEGKFNFGHIYKDCRKEKDLQLSSNREYALYYIKK